MTWSGEGLRSEVEAMFAELVVFEIPEDGFRVWNRAARLDLEKARRAYKTQKQREYDAKKRAARVCLGCGGALGRPYRQIAKCCACGAENFVAPRAA